jgi:hypothetical protein
MQAALFLVELILLMVSYSTVSINVMSPTTFTPHVTTILMETWTGDFPFALFLLIPPFETSVLLSVTVRLVLPLVE